MLCWWYPRPVPLISACAGGILAERAHCASRCCESADITWTHWCKPCYHGHRFLTSVTDHRPDSIPHVHPVVLIVALKMMTCLVLLECTTSILSACVLFSSCVHATRPCQRDKEITQLGTCFYLFIRASIDACAQLNAVFYVSCKRACREQVHDTHTCSGAPR